MVNIGFFLNGFGFVLGEFMSFGKEILIICLVVVWMGRICGWL